MTRSLYEITFDLRYAVRVLERQASYWRKLYGLTRIAGLLASTAAFGAIISNHPWWTLGLGLGFAILQAVEFALGPAVKAAEAHQTAKMYEAALAEQLRKEPTELEQWLLDARIKDNITVFASLRRLAYNDVVQELGRDEHAYRLSAWQRFMSMLA